MKDFRIAEYDGVFIIQRKQETIETRLFRKDIKTTTWRSVNIYGGYYRLSGFAEKQRTFDNHKAAEQKINIMLQGFKYYYTVQ